MPDRSSLSSAPDLTLHPEVLPSRSLREDVLAAIFAGLLVLASLGSILAVWS